MTVIIGTKQGSKYKAQQNYFRNIHDEFERTYQKKEDPKYELNGYNFFWSIYIDILKIFCR